MGFLSQQELEKIGFKKLGKEVKVSDKASIYNPGNIEIGDYSRIDDFAVLSAGDGGIIIGRHVHIAVFTALIGKEQILLADFAGLSSKVVVYSSSDDYSGNALTGPTVPDQFRNVIHAPVKIGAHVVVGAGTTILPGVTIEKGSAIGAHSLVTKNIGESIIASGVPAKPLKGRSTKLFDLESKLSTS